MSASEQINKNLSDLTNTLVIINSLQHYFSAEGLRDSPVKEYYEEQKAKARFLFDELLMNY